MRVTPVPALADVVCGASLRHGLAPIALLAALFSCAGRTPREPVQPPVVAGLTTAGLDARGRGLVLLEELGCVACHAPTDGANVAATTPQGPDLATVGSRVQPDHLRRFVADPGGTEPGTTMPDLLRDLDDDARGTAAAALADYVRSFAAPAANAPVEPVDPAAAARGRQLFHTIGCAMCHAPRDEAGAERAIEDAVPMAPLADKYTLPALRAFLLAPHVARPAGRMPDLGLNASEAHDLANYLREMVPFVSFAADALPPADAGVQLGRTLFAERGCVHCHPLTDPGRAASLAPKALRELDAARGCLSGTVGAWPFYALSTAQRSDLAAALAALASPLDDEQRIRQQLAARNCTACHARGDVGGVSQQRSDLCTSNDAGIGQESRLPPRLTGVGAKLQRAWLHDAIAHGQRERPYLRTRMPAFGAAFASGLTELLARTDTLPPLAIAPLPEDDKERRAITDLGRTLVSDKGMNCIACHTFAGEQVGTMGAIDLVATMGQRLQPQWFAHFLRAPFRFNPNTLMPQFFPDGGSVRPELGDGKAATQIDAIWHYLAEGRNVGKPGGLRRPPIELPVADEAVLLRRSVQNTGKRGISVGLPHGVNATFDAERLALNQVWWGRFLDASGVWTSQGHGEARPLGKERVALPNGPAFAVLASDDAPWPTATRRELGQRWLGYDLDAQQRPTFRYTCGDVAIEDAVREVVAEGAPADARAVLRRTLRCSGAGAATLTFLAARDARIDDLGGGLVQVGAALQMRLPAGSFRIRAVQDAQELLVSLPLVGGIAQVAIDYAFVASGK